MIGMEKLNLKWHWVCFLVAFTRLSLHYIYSLDATAEGDFLHCDGDQAFNIIKK
jgi:hypothetical protein